MDQLVNQKKFKNILDLFGDENQSLPIIFNTQLSNELEKLALLTSHIFSENASIENHINIKELRDFQKVSNFFKVILTKITIYKLIDMVIKLIFMDSFFVFYPKKKILKSKVTWSKQFLADN
ncbi:hypothetical protein BJ944DRAFT_228918 [Cunninghamella echinulata]|nr:hypothetical protein BJ944DRAFT_228918 [Cunninghamella echinulata]